ncbi:hypothetical protein [Mycobacterium sp.]|uniref:hypothetical protein n=1 Tax=Mycobacterium sp. TaxID=1785 RepID=UPI003D0C6D3D
MIDIAGDSNVNRDAEIVSDGAGLGGDLAEADDIATTHLYLMKNRFVTCLVLTVAGGGVHV